MDELYPGKYKPVLLIFSLIIILIIIVSLISTFWPKYEQQFIELGLLGKNKLADDYFSNENSAVLVNSQVDWYIYLHNHKPISQNIIIKVKLLNSSIEIPTDQKREPISLDAFNELHFSLDENETLLIPFFWSITETFSQDDLIILNDLIVNDKPIDITVSTKSDSFFRMVFELWVYDDSSQKYIYTWSNGDTISSTSLYIGFRALPL